ncbi:hypothetical protein A4R26_00695 [Niastella populi]|uniref:Uncharacterized protein n=2 Tax=Niastella populi TaxID=550983 RepID=A0A1V9GCE9_9BACT|nr:hypothetical protein A4R26_00695 [Niastella populi]
MGIGTRNPAKSVNAIMNTDTTQKKSDKGLQFSLKLHNDADTAVVIVNPLDLLRISVFDAAWKEIQFPYRGRRQGHDREWTNNTFVVNHIKINGRATDVNTFIKDYYITLPGNSKVEIFMGITKVVKPGAVMPLTVEQMITVPSGIYKVDLVCALMEGQSSVILHMPLVNIHYK